MLLALEDDRVVTPPEYRHNVFMFCVALRCMIGILAMAGMVPKWLLVALSSLMIYAFSTRALGKDTWKAYWKTVYIYASVLILTLLGKDAGVLIIMDAITGLTSRDLYSKIAKYS